MAEMLDEQSSLESTTVGVYRTSATVKGGRRFSFSSLVVVGDPVNRTARYCGAAKSGEVLISPELYERVWRIVRDAESLTVDAKFEEHLPAYSVRSLWER